MLSDFPHRLTKLFRFMLLAAAVGLAACDSVEERVAKHYERGIELINKGEYAKAALEFRNVLKLDQNNVGAHFEMIRIQEHENNIQAVVGHLNRIIELEPENVEARTKLARYMLLAGQLDAAEAQATAVLKAAPQLPEALAVKAGLALQRGQLEDAVVAAQAALIGDPGNLDAGLVLIGERLRAGDSKRALEFADQFLKVHPTDVTLNLAKLKTLQDLGDQVAVEAHLRNLVQTFPDQMQYRALLARYYDSVGNADGAEAELRAIAAANPGNKEAALDVARLLARAKGVEAGRAELERLIATSENPIPFESALAQLDFDNGRGAEARKRLEEVIARGGKSEDLAEARVQLSRFLIAAGDREGASALAEAVLASDAKNIRALIIKASLLIDAGDYDAAVVAARTGLNEDPKNVALLLLEATAHDRNGNAELTRERLGAAVGASGYAPEITLRYVRFLQERGEREAAVTVLEDALQNRPAERELISALGLAQVQLRDWTGATKAATDLRALNDQKASDAADLITAMVLSGQRKYAQTVEVLRHMDERDDGTAMGAIVQAYVDAGQTAQAVSYVEDQLQARPDDPLALRMRAMLHQLTGETEAAEAGFRTAIAAEPANARGYAVLSRFYLAESKPDDAEKTLREGLAAVPESPELMMSLAGLLELRGAFAEAIEIYGTVHEKFPGSMVAANNFASLISDHRADDPESLERAFNAAKRLRASNIPQFLDTYGWVQYLRGDYNGALRTLLPVAKQLADNPWVRYHIGMTYVKLGQPAEAREHLQATLDLAGETPFTKRDEVRVTLAELTQ